MNITAIKREMKAIDPRARKSSTGADWDKWHNLYYDLKRRINYKDFDSFINYLNTLHGE